MLLPRADSRRAPLGMESLPLQGRYHSDETRAHFRQFLGSSVVERSSTCRKSSPVTMDRAWQTQLTSQVLSSEGHGKSPQNWERVKVSHSVMSNSLRPHDPMDCSPSGSSIHGILQATIPEWGAIPFSRGSSQPRDQTQVSCIAGGFFTS